MNYRLIKPWLASCILFALFLAGTTQAQVGSGWSSWPVTMAVETESNDVFYTFSYNSNTNVDTGLATYNRDTNTSVETFTLLSSGSNRMEDDQSHPRVSTGVYQFQGYVKIQALI